MEQNTAKDQHGFISGATSEGTPLNLDNLDIQELESRLELAPGAGDDAITVSVGWDA